MGRNENQINIEFGAERTVTFSKGEPLKDNNGGGNWSSNDRQDYWNQGVKQPSWESAQTKDWKGTGDYKPRSGNKFNSNQESDARLSSDWSLGSPGNSSSKFDSSSRFVGRSNNNRQERNDGGEPDFAGPWRAGNTTASGGPPQSFRTPAPKNQEKDNWFGGGGDPDGPSSDWRARTADSKKPFDKSPDAGVYVPPSQRKPEAGGRGFGTPFGGASKDNFGGGSKEGGGAGFSDFAKLRNTPSPPPPPPAAANIRVVDVKAGENAWGSAMDEDMETLKSKLMIQEKEHEHCLEFRKAEGTNVANNLKIGNLVKEIAILKGKIIRLNTNEFPGDNFEKTYLNFTVTKLKNSLVYTDKEIAKLKESSGTYMPPSKKKELQTQLERFQRESQYLQDLIAREEQKEISNKSDFNSKTEHPSICQRISGEKREIQESKARAAAERAEAEAAALRAQEEEEEARKEAERLAQIEKLKEEKARIDQEHQRLHDLNHQKCVYAECCAEDFEAALFENAYMQTLQDQEDLQEEWSKKLCCLMAAKLQNLQGCSVDEALEVYQTEILVPLQHFQKFVGISQDEFEWEVIVHLQYACYMWKNPRLAPEWALSEFILFEMLKSKLLSKDCLIRWKSDTEDNTQGKTQMLFDTTQFFQWFVEEDPEPVVNPEELLYDTEEEEDMNEALSKVGVKRGRRY